MTFLKMWLYKIATALIILLSKLRDKFGPELHWRLDRTLPWPSEQPKWGLYMSCCDCGLSHFFVGGESGTPVRPAEYNYGLRFGAKGHTNPRPDLGQKAAEVMDEFFEAELKRKGY